jgi:hypothetical protein
MQKNLPTVLLIYKKVDAFQYMYMSAFVLQVEPIGEERAAPTLQRKGGAQESESGWCHQ